jgi:hypothetical protein
MADEDEGGDTDFKHPPPEMVPSLLSEGSYVEVSLTTYMLPPARPLQLKAELFLVLPPLTGTPAPGPEPRYCPQLHPSFTAYLGATKVPVTSPGFSLPLTHGDGYLCWRPSVTLELSAAELQPDAVLTLRDDGYRIDVPLGDLLLPRQLSLPTGSDGRFVEGAPFEVVWNPAGDLALGEVGAQVTDANGRTGFVMSSDPDPVTGVIKLTPDTTRSYRGPGFVSVLYERELTPCSGCKLKVHHELAQPVTILPRAQ